jgi:hypothetical protein
MIVPMKGAGNSVFVLNNGFYIRGLRRHNSTVPACTWIKSGKKGGEKYLK